MTKIFFSMASAVVLFLIFACSCAYATFIESIYDTQTAWASVYGTMWFGLIQLLLGLNLAVNLVKFKLFSLKKLPVLIFHLSFLFILFGAAMTRYLGVEGNLHIRENSSQNLYTTAQSYIQLKAIDENSTYLAYEPKFISQISGGDFELNLDVAGETARLKYAKFIPNAVFSWQKDDSGDGVLEILFSNEENSRLVTLRRGENIDIGDIDFSFDAPAKKAEFITISLKNDEFFINTNQDVKFMQMSDMSRGQIAKNQNEPFKPLRLYSIEGLNFAPKTMLAHAKHSIASAPKNERGTNAILANLSFKNQSQEVAIFENSAPTLVNLGGVLFAPSWSPVSVALPFSVHLSDFELKRYPGSNSPMSYSSFVRVDDENSSFDYHIFMNHVLDYKGYRFFQHSYDADERGTILSVNKDPGKIPTYIGYFLLGLGLILNIFNPNSRFSRLNSAINSPVLAIALVFAAVKINAYDALPKIDENHARALSTLIIQSSDGRMKPFDTLAHDILNKLYRSDEFGGMNANAVILSMMVNPNYWRVQPIIKISDNELKKILNLRSNYASFNDFFKEENGDIEYKIIKQSELANRKAPATRNKFDKDVIKADEKLNILYMIFMGELFRAVPRPNDPQNTWYSPASAVMDFSQKDRALAVDVVHSYFTAVINAQASGDWSGANEALDKFKAYQAEFGAAVMPDESHVEFELAFNKYKIFKNLIPVYLIAGFALLVVVFARMISPKARLNSAFRAVYIINILAFLAHTTGLAIRWYIAKHAPWSDSYESMTYIAWALALSGIIFSRRSAISLALTSILAGVTLFVAHLSWIDPQITNLVPVLQSYWLTIHVSVITASYGFLGLCALLGFFVLLLFSVKNEKPAILSNIAEATKINEMAMILGLSLLTLGNFLGAVWANESWGRYWGWDSKETWALISILIYAAVLHLRFIPRLNSQYVFALASMFAYLSILMTYFGVNFYLAGMHSYAEGDIVGVPNFVWIGLGVMVSVSLLALRGKKFAKRL